jgi:RND family efflux transporter MFP subunit
MSSEVATGRKQLIGVILFVVIAFGLSTWMTSKYQPPPTSLPEARSLSVAAETVLPQTYNLRFNLNGFLVATHQVTLVPEVGGRIVWVHPDLMLGGKIAANQVLFKIDSRDYEASVIAAEAELARSDSLLQQIQAEAEVAKADWERVYPAEPARDLVLKKPQQQEAKAAVLAAEAGVKKARLNLERTQYRLPFDVTVQQVSLSVGQQVFAGQSYGQVYQANALEVEIDLTAQERLYLLQAANAVAKVRLLQGDQSVEQNAKLVRSISQIDPKTGLAKARFKLTKPPKDWLAGSFVSANLQGPTFVNTYGLPLSALQTDDTIWLVENKKLQLADFNIIQKTPEKIWVQSSRLQGQWQVVSSRLSGPIVGQSVSIRQTNDSGAPK